jgi:hypothetical protein
MMDEDEDEDEPPAVCESPLSSLCSFYARLDVVILC